MEIDISEVVIETKNDSPSVAKKRINVASKRIVKNSTSVSKKVKMNEVDVAVKYPIVKQTCIPPKQDTINPVSKDSNGSVVLKKTSNIPEKPVPPPVTPKLTEEEIRILTSVSKKIKMNEVDVALKYPIVKQTCIDPKRDTINPVSEDSNSSVALKKTSNIPEKPVPPPVTPKLTEEEMRILTKCLNLTEKAPRSSSEESVIIVQTNANFCSAPVVLQEIFNVPNGRPVVLHHAPAIGEEPVIVRQASIISNGSPIVKPVPCMSEGQVLSHIPSVHKEFRQTPSALNGTVLGQLPYILKGPVIVPQAPAASQSQGTILLRQVPGTSGGPTIIGQVSNTSNGTVMLNQFPGNSIGNLILTQVPGNANGTVVLSQVPGNTNGTVVLSQVPGNTNGTVVLSQVPGNTNGTVVLSRVPGNTNGTVALSQVPETPSSTLLPRVSTTCDISSKMSENVPATSEKTILTKISDNLTILKEAPGISDSTSIPNEITSTSNETVIQEVPGISDDTSIPNEITSTSNKTVIQEVPVISNETILEAFCTTSDGIVLYKNVHNTADGKMVSEVLATVSDREINEVAAASDREINEVSAASDRVTELEETFNISHGTDVQKDETESQDANLISCFICHKEGYKAMKFLKQHLRRIHGYEDPKSRARPIVCIEQCGESFSFMKAYRKHLAQKHDIINVDHPQHLEFNNIDDFNIWLQNEEVSNCVHYVKNTSDKHKKGCKVIYYQCNRSGKNKTSNEIRKKPRRTNKIGFVCTSTVNVTHFYEGKVQVAYYSCHYKHEMSTLNLPKKLRPEQQNTERRAPENDDNPPFKDVFSVMDPHLLFQEWYTLATTNEEIKEANAMVLATANNKGIPSARYVYLQHYNREGFRFCTNHESQKAKEMCENSHASLLFYWQPLNRQVRIEGVVEKLTEYESNDFFHSQSQDSQFVAVISKQGQIIRDRSLLKRKKRYMVKKYKDSSDFIPKPAHWGVYLVKPSVYEFWQGRSSCIHDRVRFRHIGRNEVIDEKMTVQGERDWYYERLAP